MIRSESHTCRGTSLNWHIVWIASQHPWFRFLHLASYRIMQSWFRKFRIGSFAAANPEQLFQKCRMVQERKERRELDRELALALSLERIGFIKVLLRLGSQLLSFVKFLY